MRKECALERVCLTWKKPLIQLSCQSYLKSSSTLVFGADAGELFIVGTPQPAAE